MKISYNWLQRHIEEKLPDAEALKQVIIFHAFEVEDTEEVNGDVIMDIKVLPDRAHDCLGHAGVAKEIAGLLGLSLKENVLPELPTVPLSTKIEVQSDVCRRYISVEMKDIKIDPSPDWLKDAIEGVGLRSINNVVDATNLVLLDDGQPVHAYDADKIDGGIVVRVAHEGEQITTLSKEEKVLKETDLIIADYLGALAIAGVKGGTSAEITDDTKRIIVEVANFTPAPIRKTSRRLNLVTDASKRFENELTPEIAYDAARHVVAIIQKVAGGEVTGLSDYYPKQAEARSLSFSISDITRLLGPTIAEADIDLWIYRYHISSTKEGGVYNVAIPDQRLDITGPHDIAEEIGRMIGYDRIPASPLPFTPIVQKESEYLVTTSVKYWLAQNGFREVMNYTFTKKGDVYISYGAKDKSALRSNLSETLKESYEKNRINAGLLGLDAIRIFEIGTVFIGTGEHVHVATCDKGNFEELPIQQFIEKYKIDTTINTSQQNVSGTFKMWSPYPFVSRDIAVWISSPEDQAKLEEIVTAFASQYCVREPVLFDHFEKEGRTSIAYRFVFQSYEKTLTEVEVEKWFAELVEKIKSEKGFEIR
jgi:phenylalanyl-tRNA synthetase beta chain